jgi:four helix bundle protein
MKKFSFEKLEVWQDAKGLTHLVYKATKNFPSEEKYGLVSQLRRAVISVTSNIAEGSSRMSSKDQAHFYHLAFSSLMEVLSQIIISFELGYIPEEESFRIEISKIANKLNSLRKSSLNPVNK